MWRGKMIALTLLSPYDKACIGTVHQAFFAVVLADKETPVFTAHDDLAKRLVIWSRDWSRIFGARMSVPRDAHIPIRDDERHVLTHTVALYSRTHAHFRGTLRTIEPIACKIWYNYTGNKNRGRTIKLALPFRRWQSPLETLDSSVIIGFYDRRWKGRGIAESSNKKNRTKANGNENVWTK